MATYAESSKLRNYAKNLALCKPVLNTRLFTESRKNRGLRQGMFVSQPVFEINWTII